MFKVQPSDISWRYYNWIKNLKPKNSGIPNGQLFRVAIQVNVKLLQLELEKRS